MTWKKAGIEVQATDKGSKADLAAWAKTVGHQYIGTVEEGDVFIHYIRKCRDDTMVEKTFEPTISHEEIEKREGLVLDVREEAEFAFGHIEGAKSIPMGELESRLGNLIKIKKYISFVVLENDLIWPHNF